MALGGDIQALDYNTVREKIDQVLGVGSGTFGYGQTLQSSPVFAEDVITKAQWDNLRYDILNARIHQIGQSPNLIVLSSEQLIDDRANDPVVNYNTQAEICSLDRLRVDATQAVVSAIGPGNASIPVAGQYDYTSPWSSELSIELTCTFNNANDARYFFNTGSKIQITPTIDGFTSTAQTENWNSLLTQAGTQEFGANTDPSINFYSLTDNYQTFYIASGSASYASNTIKFEAKCDVEDNTQGTATIVYIKTTLTDNYIDLGLPAPGDEIDGTTRITFTEFKASGDLQPSGSFSVTSPFYALSSFSAS